MCSIHPSIHHGTAHQAGAGQLPSIGKEHPRSRQRWAVGPQGERNPSRAEISGTNRLCAAAELPSPARAASRTWGTRDRHGGGERPHRDVSAVLQTHLEKVAAVYEPALLLTGLAESTRRGARPPWDGVLEIPAPVETHLHHKIIRLMWVIAEQTSF